MKRHLSFLLILAVLLSLISCSNKGNNENSTVESPTEGTANEDLIKAKENIADLPDADWNRVFRIATDDPTLILPQNGASYVGKKLMARNQAVEEKYNVKIVKTDESGSPAVVDRIRVEALAGSDYCDLAVISASACQQLVSEGALQNVATIPYVSSSGKGVYERASNAFTIGNNVYALCGDFCYSADPVFVVYFNKTIASNAGLGDLYQLVLDHQWDQANFLECAQEAYSLPRYRGQKVYGFTSSERAETLLQAFWASSDLSYVDNAYGSKPALIYDSNPNLKGFIAQSGKILHRSVTYLDNVNASLDAFRDGQVLFYVAPLSKISELGDCQTDWGILPIPVYDINQNTHESYQGLSYQVACFPKGIEDINFSGQITEALFAASDGLSQDLTLTKYLNLYLPSARDGEMVKQIIQEPYFDPTEFFGAIYPEYLTATQTIIQRVVFSDGDYNKLYKQNSLLFSNFINEKVS